jgi:putative redox protein
LDREKIEKAVNLSVDKYCGVTAILGKTARMSHEIVLNPGD